MSLSSSIISIHCCAQDLPEFRRAKTIIDVGTGGGFPGIPLAVSFSGKTVYVVDSLNKRIQDHPEALR